MKLRWDTTSIRAGRRYTHDSLAKASYQDIAESPFIVGCTVPLSDLLMVDVDDDRRILGIEYLGGHITESQLIEVLKRCLLPQTAPLPRPADVEPPAQSDESTTPSADA